MTEPPDVPPPGPATPPPTRISESDAAHVWRRAAELQAEAMHRLESRARELRSGRGGEAGGELSSDEGFSLEDVREAAREAGIEGAFVDRALSELRHERSALSTPRDGVDRLADRLLDAPSGSLVVSRVIEGEGRAVLRALNQILTGTGYRLTLVDAEDRDPLQGGLLTFRIPAWNGLSTEDVFAYRASWLWARTVLVTIRPLAARDASRWEVELMLPLRGGRRVNAWSSLAVTSVGGVAGGGAGVGLGALALGVIGASGGALALPVLALAAAGGLAGGGVATMGLYRWGWRHGGRQMGALLDETLRRVQLELRTGGTFTAPPPDPPDLTLGGIDRWLGSI